MSPLFCNVFSTFPVASDCPRRLESWENSQAGFPCTSDPVSTLILALWGMEDGGLQRFPSSLHSMLSHVQGKLLLWFLNTRSLPGNAHSDIASLSIFVIPDGMNKKKEGPSVSIIDSKAFWPVDGGVQGDARTAGREAAFNMKKKKRKKNKSVQIIVISLQLPVFCLSLLRFIRNILFIGISALRLSGLFLSDVH